MNRAQRLLTLAYKAHQRGEAEIAGRITTFAFADPDAAGLFERINASESSAATHVRSETEKAEAVLRTAEASAQGNLFSNQGVSSLLAIAGKAHNDGLPKVAKLIAEVAQ